MVGIDEATEVPIEATMRCHGSNHDAAASLVGKVSVSLAPPLILVGSSQKHLQIINTARPRMTLSKFKGRKF